MEYICSKCSNRQSVYDKEAKCTCGGLWKLDFKPQPFSLDLIDRKYWGLMRYHAFLPVSEEVLSEVTLGEGMTPVVPLEEGLLAKMDYFMPTLSFKDRGAAVLIAHCKHIGVTSVVQDSSGNAGNSVAAYSAKAQIGCEIYVPEGTSPKKIDMIQAHGAKVNVVPGSRDHCAEVCRDQVEKRDVYYASHVYNPYFYQGTKTYIYEVYEQLGRIPEHIFVPLGNGTLFIGVIKGLEECMASGLIDHMPRIYAVQSEHCAPFHEAFKQGAKSPAKIDVKPTLAEGIAIGLPMRGEEILKYIYQYGIEVVTAPESQILAARDSLSKKGLYCEHTTAATYAAYKKLVEEKGKLKDALIPLCGAGLKSDH